jgi:hypothetical protein
VGSRDWCRPGMAAFAMDPTRGRLGNRDEGVLALCRCEGEEAGHRESNSSSLSSSLGPLRPRRWRAIGGRRDDSRAEASDVSLEGSSRYHQALKFRRSEVSRVSVLVPPQRGTGREVGLRSSSLVEAVVAVVAGPSSKPGSRDFKLRSRPPAPPPPASLRA